MYMATTTCTIDTTVYWIMQAVYIFCCPPRRTKSVSSYQIVASEIRGHGRVDKPRINVNMMYLTGRRHLLQQPSTTINQYYNVDIIVSRASIGCSSWHVVFVGPRIHPFSPCLVLLERDADRLIDVCVLHENIGNRPPSESLKLVVFR